MRTSSLVLTSLLLVGCSHLRQPEVTTTPPGFDGFPVVSSDSSVWAEAVLPREREELFGDDPVDAGLLPIGLRLGAWGDTAEASAPSTRGLQGTPGTGAVTLDAFLYLSDGTVLRAENPADTLSGEELETALRLAVSDDGLPAPGTFREGFLYFALNTVRVEKHYALTYHVEHFREVDLYHSLLVFRVSSPEGPREVRVGLRPASFSPASFSGAAR